MVEKDYKMIRHFCYISILFLFKTKYCEWGKILQYKNASITV